MVTIMTAANTGKKNGRDPPGGFTDPVPRLAWTLEQSATRLGLSVRTFYELRESHPLYEPDGSRCLGENPKRDMPLWSEDLIRLIAFSRSLTAQKVRQLTDDEALAVRRSMEESKRRQYLALID